MSWRGTAFTSTLVVLSLVGSVMATVLDFSLSTNPSPLSPYSGVPANGDHFYPPNPPTHDGLFYGSYISNSDPYATWLRRGNSPGPYTAINPQTQHTDGGVGWTPDIAVQFNVDDYLERVYMDAAYGDLTGVLYSGSSVTGATHWPIYFSDDNTDVEINPVLHSFDLAYYQGGTLARIRVSSYDGVNVTHLWEATNVVVPANGHVSFDFGGVPIVGTEQSLWINYTTQAGQPLYNVALDNIVISQTPEPDALILLLTGVVPMLRRRS